MAGLAYAPATLAQTAPSIIVQPRIEPPQTQTPGFSPVRAPSAAAPMSVAPADIADQSFMLKGVQVQGATAFTADQLATAWAGKIGQTIKVSDAYAIGDRVAAEYTAAGYALFRVSVLQQNFADGIVHLQVIEGYVDAVQIQGDTEGLDLDLLRGYAAHIVEDRPLRQATLERYILLMNSMPGFTVGSDFQPIPGAAPGVVLLRLGVKFKRFQYGIGVQNQGQNILGQTQAGANGVVNSLLRNGDRTQLSFSTPIDLRRFQYMALTHSTPLGTNGATISFSVADLLTHPIKNGIAGNAFTTGVTISYPIIRAIHESMIATFGGDMLNSDNALLGLTLSDERTRSVRVGLYYANDTFMDGITSMGFTIAKGIDALGARRASLAYGGPDYAKATLRIDREQHLPLEFVARLKVFGQISDGRLPPSEQFAFGGTDFGQALQASSITGDRAIAASVELAHPFPAIFNTRLNTGSEYFVYADWGRLWNAPTLYQYKADGASTAGLGVRTKLLDKVTVQLIGATVLDRPRTPGANRGWRLVVNVTGSF
jgi:hemolysin activation/secretion protein